MFEETKLWSVDLPGNVWVDPKKPQEPGKSLKSRKLEEIAYIKDEVLLVVKEIVTPIKNDFVDEIYLHILNINGDTIYRDII